MSAVTVTSVPGRQYCRGRQCTSWSLIQWKAPICAGWLTTLR